MYRTLNFEIKKAIATVTLNRPESRNAISARLMREMIACAGRIAGRHDIDVVIVRGSGACFSAGADLKAFALRRATPRRGYPAASR